MTGLPHAYVLHGANGSGPEMEPLAAPLRAYAQVRAPNLPGHGGRPLPARLSVEGAAADVVAQLDGDGVERAFLVGYSLGGLVALYCARHFPARVAGACAIATKFHFDAATVQHWSYLAQPERLLRPGNPRAAEMERAHGLAWTQVTAANARLFADLGSRPPLPDEELSGITRPALLVNANRDQLVKWEETVAVAKRIPGARLVMFYGVAHPLARVPAEPVARAIGEWMAG